MSTKTWREISQSVIAHVAAQAHADGCDEAETLKRIDAAYPFGERAYHPYKIWLSERKRWRFGQPQGAAELRRAEGSSQARALLAAWNAGEPIR